MMKLNGAMSQLSFLSFTLFISFLYMKCALLCYFWYSRNIRLEKFWSR
jgi:hypothetical protein